MSSGGGILELIGASDNFDETPGFFNYPGNILGVTITFMVWNVVNTYPTNIGAGRPGGVGGQLIYVFALVAVI